MNKICTDIKQSKILAEILPIESADMTYRPIMDIDSMSNSEFLNIPECYPFNEFKDCIIKPLPCWSLSALLEQLHYPSLHKTISGWRCDCYNKDGSCFKFGINAPTEVDACVKMIELLHKENLI